MHRPDAFVLPAAILACFFLVGFGFTAAQSMGLAAIDGEGIPLAEAIQPASLQADLAPPVEPVAAEPAVDTGCLIGSSYPQAVTRWCGLMERAAAENDLAVDLIAALMLEESGGDPLAYSVDGAVGLLQVMPRDGLAKAFQCMNGPCFASRPSIEELQNPEFNLTYGSRFLKGLLNRTGDMREALKAYGPAGLEYAYADAVLAIRENYQPGLP